MAIKSQKPNLEGFAEFYLIVFQLFAPHQAVRFKKKKNNQKTTNKKTAKHVSMRIIPVFLPVQLVQTSSEVELGAV